MKPDNSVAFEEKFQEGYYTRCREIEEASLIVIGDVLYELTPRQLNKFRSIRLYSSFPDKWHRSFDYVRKYCKPLNTNIRVFNY